MTHHFNYFLLDWDGTLVMTLTIALDAYREAFAEIELYPSDEEIVTKAFGDWNPARKFPIPDNQQFIDRIVQLINERMNTVELYPGVRDTLEQLKNAGKHLAVVTSSKRSTVEPAIKRLDLGHYFDVVLGKEDFVHEKPDPEILLKAMDQIHAVKEETVIVGDSPKDVEAGQRAGISTVRFYPKENELFYKGGEKDTPRANYLINSFEAIFDLGARVK